MTAPVAQSADAEGEWTIRFFMPRNGRWTPCPPPNDDRLRLTVVSAETVAVLTFAGDRGPRSVAERPEELQNTLRYGDFEPISEPAAWFYDPPWTLPFRRRNEIAIAVRQCSGG